MLGCRLNLPLVCFYAPYPPSPRSQSALPRRGRGRFLVFSCKGLRPLHPRGWTGRGTGCPPPFRLSRGACFFSCWLRWALTLPGGARGGWGYPPHLPLVCFLAPYPPAPFPGGEGGDFYFISPGATAPGTPASEPGRHPRREPLPAVFAANHRFSSGDARGKAPCMK